MRASIDFARRIGNRLPPVSLVLTYDRVLDPGAVCHFDLGALWDRGLGLVINGQDIMRSDIVREVARIPEDEVIMTCVAMGHLDDGFAANAVRSDREPNGDFVRFVGFADRCMPACAHDRRERGRSALAPRLIPCGDGI